jgi:hypothetical protein
VNEVVKEQLRIQGMALVILFGGLGVAVGVYELVKWLI